MVEVKWFWKTLVTITIWFIIGSTTDVTNLNFLIVPHNKHNRLLNDCGSGELLTQPPSYNSEKNGYITILTAYWIWLLAHLRVQTFTALETHFEWEIARNENYKHTLLGHGWKESDNKMAATRPHALMTVRMRLSEILPVDSELYVPDKDGELMRPMRSQCCCQRTGNFNLKFR